ncbi:peptidase M10A and M12B matrixin and adamalysin [Pseudarthrobacter chlorophenolicus A6]|uniref:Peptidase M10A and M12B matrixin and adamalysin n=1 Tax=Pseudarthrobacter chlorophenolicus (strain ATCC 700700 / DSM 12829 / CIP 107037 / JCM 12360 / KCTC 9906 / NCIMB 13794 / A6) TaxID=452863 RepID=B8HDF1_PSECP|nr:matrixin family metalloprotease [Pseudarthrobacter chlorophenolicus]ACL38956.1 peptidase M10A and M12B matrixin and adamalysin [Pseudarthrobacter chlorophenolicus A6]SDR06416.1 Matrixin [Pseudarthrobacter chlorophenolicus]
MEEFPPRHAGNRPQRKHGPAYRAVLAVALCTAAVLGGALALGDPRISQLFSAGEGHGEGPGLSQEKPEEGREDPLSGSAGEPSAASTDAPPPGYEEESAPLAEPEVPAVGSDSYGFLAVNGDGTPVGYSPCRPLHYVVNDQLAPAGSDRLVPDAISTISAATGITFVYDGTTGEQPSPQRAAYQPAAYGERWAPLLIAWTTPEASPELAGKVIGTGGSTHFSFDGGPKTFVTGSLDLDAPQITEELRRPDGRLYAAAVILHELGHVMGLDHVADPAQLMYPEIGGSVGASGSLADGDLNGLYELSKAQCRKDL